MGNILYYLLILSISGLVYSFWKYRQVKKAGPDKGIISEIGFNLKKESLHYLQLNYKLLLLFCISAGVLLYFESNTGGEKNLFIVISYLMGSGISALSTYYGTKIAGSVNSIVANESRQTYQKGFWAAHAGSSSIALLNISLLILGVLVLLLAYSFTGGEIDSSTMLNKMAAFALGASTVSMFTRIGGGLFKSSAEICDYQIQKTEPGITENSIHNPASLALDTGKLISQTGGTGAELFESFSVALIAAMLIGVGFTGSNEIVTHLEMGPILVPLAIGSAGILSSIAGLFILKATDKKNAEKMTGYAEILSSVILVLSSFFIIQALLPGQWDQSSQSNNQIHTVSYFSWGVFWSALFGVLAAVVIGKSSSLFFNQNTKTVQSAVTESIKTIESGFFAGFKNGFMGMGPNVAVILLLPIVSYYFAGLYGLGIAAVSMLANLGFYYTLGCFAPVASIANTIAIKEGMEPETIQQTFHLKQTGISNQLRIRILNHCSTTLATIALFSAFIAIGKPELNISKTVVWSGILLGAFIPFFINSSVFASIGRISKKMISETKRQFTEIPELREAREILDKYKGDLSLATSGEKETVYAAADHVENNKLTEISTFPSVFGALLPGLLVLLMVPMLGYFAGFETLTAFLTGMLASSVLLSLFLITTGSSFESSKTAFENGIEINGENISKETGGYLNSVSAYRFANPFQDSLSPALLIIAKLALLIAVITVTSIL